MTGTMGTTCVCPGQAAEILRHSNGVHVLVLEGRECRLGPLSSPGGPAQSSVSPYQPDQAKGLSVDRVCTARQGLDVNFDAKVSEGFR